MWRRGGVVVASFAVAGLFLATRAPAASIVWSSPTNITSDANIITNGNFAYGGYFSAGAGTVAINGVTFTGSAGSKNFGSNTTANFANGGTAYSGMGVGTGLSANYQTLLGGCVYGGTALNSVTLRNLTIGNRYWVQLWINDSRSNGANSSNTVSTFGSSPVTLDYNHTEAAGGRGQFAVGTFIADGTTQLIELKSNQSGQFNALQVRRLPALTNVTAGINATQTVRTVDNRVFAANTAIYDAQLQGPASVPLLFESDNQALRWPGGSYGDTFHQATEHLRPSYEPRTTNFLYIARHTGAQHYMIANYGTGTPEEAADWVRYCNITNQAGCKYWEIGNEIPGTWEADQVIAPFVAADILDLPSLAAKLYTPTNNISTYVRGTFAASTLTTLSNYMASPGPNSAALTSALVSELNQLVNGTPSPVKVHDPTRFAGVMLRTVTSNNVALPIPTTGQDVNNRMVLEDAYATELAKVSPAIDLASNWPDVYLPHDPWTYAQRFAQYYTQMKAVDPTIKIGAVGETSESGNANGYTHHFGVNLRTGTTNYAWMPVVLATLRSLGVTPDFIVYHNYAGSGDAALLQWSKRLAEDAADMRQLLNDYIGAASTNTELAITEVGGSGSDQSSTSLVGGLFLADNTGRCLQSEFSTRLWWAFRNGGGAVAANTNIYGWRNFQDYGSVPRTDSTALTNRYPTYYATKLLQHFARGGDKLVQVTNDSTLLVTYAVKRANGALTLLVINKSPTVTHTGNFNFIGFNADTNATLWSYGIPQDEAARTGVGAADLAVTNLPVTSPTNFSLSFAPYSMSVLSFGAADATILAKRFQARISFPNYPRSEVLTNFPALVVLGTNVPGFSYASFSSPTAGDLRFKSGDGATDLNFEIERWNPYGQSYVWVQVPRFTNNCSVLAQWGGPDRVAPVTSTNGATWTNGYVGVWHLGGLTATDSARGHASSIDGTPTVLGRTGVGATFKNTANDTIQVPWDADFDLATNFEVSGWFNIAPGDKTDFRTLTAKETSNSFSDRNWWIATRADGKLWWKSSPSLDLTNTTDVCDGQWHHFAAVHDGTTARLYLDGALAGTDASPGSASTQNAPLQFGEELGAGRRWVGLLDEIRISNVSRSSNWVWATYQVVASNSAFASVAAVTTNTPPVLAGISSHTVIAGATLLVTNAVTDIDVPAQTLLFSLLASPPVATITTNTGVISWRPLMLQAGATYPFTVSVADNGAGNLSATQSFNVTVTLPVRPVLNGLAITNGQFRFSVSGDFGPDYTVQTSTNLSAWTTLFTTNSPPLPFGWTDVAATTYPSRFYRVLLAP
jgi:hypothetical protein